MSTLQIKRFFFTVEAQTTGWIGFGISTGQGKMQGADIVIGWVKDGKTYFKVSFVGEGYKLTEICSSQELFYSTSLVLFSLITQHG